MFQDITKHEEKQWGQVQFRKTLQNDALHEEYFVKNYKYLNQTIKNVCKLAKKFKTADFFSRGGGGGNAI